MEATAPHCPTAEEPIGYDEGPQSRPNHSPGVSGGRSEGGDEVRQLSRVAALDHVDDVAVLVRGGVPAAPQPPRLGVQPVRPAAALDQIAQPGQAGTAVVLPPG